MKHFFKNYYPYDSYGMKRSSTMSNRLSWNCLVGQVCMEYQNIAEGYDDRRNSTFDNFLFRLPILMNIFVVDDVVNDV